MSVSRERAAHWKDLAQRQKGINIAVFAVLGLIVLVWFAETAAPNLSLPSTDIYVWVAFGILELLNCYRPAEIGWRNSRPHFIAKLCGAVLEIKPVMRIVTLLPFVVVAWYFSQTLTLEGFPHYWQSLGLRVGDVGWLLFFGLISPLYVSRSIALLSENSTDQQHRLALTKSIRTSWRFAAIAVALIGLNIFLNRLGQRTFWREANLLYIVIFFFPVWLDQVKRKARATADKPAA